MRALVGVDEAGRGPLAGPVSVGVVVIKDPTLPRLRGANTFFKGIRDSKKLSAEERELWYALALEAKKQGGLDFHVALVSERVIDRHGIAYAIRLGVKRCLKALGVAHDDQIFLDGSLKAPSNFKHQQTIIKGDEKVPVISLASIMAKVTRDRKMIRLAQKFPEFKFDIHKGYGTRVHLSVLRKLGPTPIHRRSFLKSLT